MRGRRALVTGGGGFVGSHLVTGLIAEGAEVRVLDDFSTGSRANLAEVKDRIDLVEGSVLDRDVCADACVGVDVVFHQAALPSVQRSVADPRLTHDVGATGTLNVLTAAREAGVERFIYAGSSSAYGDTTELPKREDMPERPRSPYAVAKLAGEHYTRVFAGVFDMAAVVLRYFNVFGPRQDPASQYSAAIPLFISHALEGRPPVINGDGEQTRDFTFIDNVVHANLLAARAEAADVSGETFNVGAGERTSVNELWELICTTVGADLAATHGPPRPGDVRDSLASLEKIEERMGYAVQVPLAEGIRRTAAWFRERAAVS